MRPWYPAHVRVALSNIDAPNEVFHVLTHTRNYPGLLVCNRLDRECDNRHGFVGYTPDGFPLYKRGSGPPVPDYGQSAIPIGLQGQFMNTYGNTTQNVGGISSKLSQPGTLPQPAGAGLGSSLLNTPMAPPQPGSPSQATGIPAPTSI